MSDGSIAGRALQKHFWQNRKKKDFLDFMDKLDSMLGPDGYDELTQTSLVYLGWLKTVPDFNESNGVSYSFSERLLRARLYMSLSQADLAKLSGIGPTKISMYEGDKGMPSAKNIVRLARSLKVSTDYLLGLDVSG